jgi:hypothetical protein
MPGDLTLETREAIIVALRADAALTALLPAERIYGMASDPDATYPFVRYGVPITSPLAGACVDATIHVYADGPSEDEACAIAKEIVRVLGDAALKLDPADPDTPVITLRWTGGQTLTDPSEPDIIHAYRTFAATAVG